MGEKSPCGGSTTPPNSSIPGPRMRPALAARVPVADNPSPSGPDPDPLGERTTPHEVHSLVAVPKSHVYVHCMAGLVRSPTILWLYLIALGIPPTDARNWIEERRPLASAGSARMVDHEHVLLAQMHGLKHFFPHPRSDIIVPFEIPPEG